MRSSAIPRQRRVVTRVAAAAALLLLFLLSSAAHAAVYSYVNWGPAGQYLSTYDTRTGVESLIRTSSEWNGASAARSAVSPDGLTVAWADYYGVHVAPVGGGSIITILPRSPADNWYVYNLSYTADGSAVLVSKQDRLSTDDEDIVRVPTDGGDQSTVIGGPGDEFDASSSADGSTLAYIEDPDQGGQPQNWQLWTANASGGARSMVTDMAPVTEAAQSNPLTDHEQGLWTQAISPNGSKIAFTTYGTTGGNDSLWVINSDGSGLRQLLTAGAFDNAMWAGDDEILVSNQIDGAMRSVRPDGTDEHTVDVGSGYNYSLQQHRSGSAINYQDLLQRYRPVLAYDSYEQYWADSTQEAMDATGDVLRDENGAVIAEQNPDYQSVFWPMSLDTLASLAPTASDHDYIDEGPNNNDPSEATRLHALSPYGNINYGRVVQQDGQYWLQYWMYYFYDYVSYSAISDTGDHQGDWEMVQIHLDGSGTPDTVTLSQHAGKVKCDWPALNHGLMGETGSVSPIIYVADGSHANYPQPGRYDTHDVAGVTISRDYADGHKDEVLPTTRAFDPWVNWPGRWGATEPQVDLGLGLQSASPAAPPFGHGDPYTAPGTYDNNAASCNSPDGSADLFPRSAHRSGTQAVSAAIRHGGSGVVTPQAVSGRVAAHSLHIRISASALAKHGIRATRLVVLIRPRSHGATPRIQVVQLRPGQHHAQVRFSRARDAAAVVSVYSDDGRRTSPVALIGKALPALQHRAHHRAVARRGLRRLSLRKLREMRREELTRTHSRR